jgi:hypothetical protein
MSMSKIVERFEQQSPICVMVRAALENVFSSERLQSIFDQHARRQCSGELMFSTVAGMMASVVCRIQPSINAAYRADAENISVTVKAGLRQTAGHRAERIAGHGARNGPPHGDDHRQNQRSVCSTAARLSRQDR